MWTLLPFLKKLLANGAFCGGAESVVFGFLFSSVFGSRCGGLQCFFDPVVSIFFYKQDKKLLQSYIFTVTALARTRGCKRIVLR